MHVINVTILFASFYHDVVKLDSCYPSIFMNNINKHAKLRFVSRVRAASSKKFVAGS